MRIEYFKDDRTSPPKDFLNKLDENITTRFDAYLHHLAEGGKLLGAPFNRPVTFWCTPIEK